MNILFRLFFAFLVSLLLCNTSYSKEIKWQFDDAEDIKGWTMSNAYIKPASPGIIYKLGPGFFSLISPSNLDIPPNLSHLQFRLKAQTSELFGFVIIKTIDDKTWSVTYPLKTDNKFGFFQINLKQLIQTDAAIDSLTFTFGGIDEVELDYVKFIRPKFSDPMKAQWQEFWKVSPVAGTTVHFTEAPIFMGKPFLVSLYIILLLLTVFLVIVFKLLKKHYIIKPLFISFAVTGILFAVRMDYQWYKQWPEQQTTHSQNGFYERLVWLGNFETYSLANKLKQLVPSDKTVRFYTEGDRNRLLLKYYLLPLIYSDSGDYILVYADRRVSFDTERKKLMIDNRAVAENVSLVRVFDDGASLYKTHGLSQP